MGCPLDCKCCLNKKCHSPIYQEDGKTICKGVMLLTPQELYDIVEEKRLQFQIGIVTVCF